MGYNYENNPLYDYIEDTRSFQVVVEDALLKLPISEDNPGTDKGAVFSISDAGQIKVKFDSLLIAKKSGTAWPSGGSTLSGYSVKVGDLLTFKTTESGLHTEEGPVCKVTGFELKDGSTNVYDTVILDTVPVLISSSGYSFPVAGVDVRLCGIYKNYSGAVDVASDDVDTGNKEVEISTEIKLYDENYTDSAAEEDQKHIMKSNIQLGFGNFYPEFRVMVDVGDSDDVLVLGDEDAIQEELGAITPQNELAYAAWCALKGSAGRDIYAIRIRSHSVKGFMDAIKKTDSDPFPYTFVPILDMGGENDDDIVDALTQYCNDKSQPDVQLWRTLMVGADPDGEYVVDFIPALVTGDANEFTFMKKTSTDTKHNYLQLNDRNGRSFRRVSIKGIEGQLAKGDYIKINNNVYTIKNVIADNLLEVVDGPSTPETASTAELIKADTTMNQKAYLHAIAQRISDRRGVLVWCDGGVYNGEEIRNAYLASEIAGLCSSVLPQQSITLTEMQSITSCSKMYTQYTQKQLDDIAAGGVLIVTQDNKYGVPYIRHQLTTDSTHGSLYSELSITRNLDNISYAVADVIKGYCGRANVTVTSLPRLKADILDVLNGFTQDSVDDLIGPSLVRFYDLSIKQDPKQLDTVIVRVTYELPLPMNNIKVYQVVYAAKIFMESND